MYNNYYNYIGVGNQVLSYCYNMSTSLPYRRMFPPVIVSVKGLDPESLYSVSLSILPVDEYRYRYRQGDGWTKIGKGARQCSLQTFTHPDSRNLGSHWMRRPISFKTVKLTNNATSIDSDQVSSA